uniref:DUF3504 domain-containing protein n=1 Tax=Mesocestoides corti TaxID=53468 RepID=A0A5K3F917_MESCO
MSTVPLVSQWTPDLAKMNQNDFQSICKLALSQVISIDGKPISEVVDRPTFLKNPSVQGEEDGASPPKGVERFVHFLRCSHCGLESINKTRFDSHLPCSQATNGDHRYSLHTCSACFACSTSQDIMDEHIDLFHKGARVELIRTQEMLRPTSMAASNTPSTLSPTSVATNTTPSSLSPSFRPPNKSSDFPLDLPKQRDDTGCLDLSTTTTTSTTVPFLEHQRNGAEGLRKCHVCGVEVMGSMEEWAKHLAFVHLIPMPLMIGQLAAMAVGMKGKAPSPASMQSTSILSLHEHMSRGAWDLPSLLAVSNSLGQNTSSERLPQFSFPFGQMDSKSQHNTPSPFPLGSKNLFGLNFDLPSLPVIEQNGDTVPCSTSISEPEFKRARTEGHSVESQAFFPRLPPLDSRFSPTSAHPHTSPSLYPPPPPPPPPAGLFPRIPFLNVAHSSSDQQSTQSTPRTTAKGVPDGRPRQGDEPAASGAPGIVHNTLRKTKSDMKVIHRYLVQVKNDTREIHEIPPQDLCKYIQDFIVTAKKKDGHEYEPESLKAFVHSLERHLKYHNYPHSVLKDTEFAPARMVLTQRLNELRALSQANGSASVHRHQADGGKCDFGFPDPHDSSKLVNFDTLIQTGLLGPTNPQALLNSVWLIVRTQFNVVGTQKHRTLTWGQFQCVTNVNSQEILRFTARSNPQEVRFCHGHGGPHGVRLFDGQESNSSGNTKRQTLPFDCVDIFNFYARLRPAECHGPDEPLYLCPDPVWERGGPWFKPVVAGAQLLSRIPRLLGMKPPREPQPLAPITEAQTGPSLPHTPMPSLSQLRDNFLATMSSLLVDKIERTDSCSRRIPSFLGPQGALTPENVGVLAAGISHFPPPVTQCEKVPESARETKPVLGWSSPFGSSLDSSADDTSASSPKSLPASSNAPAGTNTERKSTLTP